METGVNNIKGSVGDINSDRFIRNLKNKNLSTREKAREVAKGFESLFVFRLLKEMRKTVPENPLFSGGFDKEFFIDIMDQEISQKVSNRGGFGIAEVLERELLERLDGNGESVSVDNIPKINPSEEGNKSKVNRRSIPEVYYNDTVSGRVEKYSHIINYFSSKYEVDNNLVKAVIAQESKGKVDAVSKKGATGLMQLMDITAKEMGVQDINNPVDNIKGGVKYLRKLLDIFDNDEKLTLAAYNSGPSAVKKYRGVPPYKETQDFVSNVLKFKKLFDKKRIF